MRSLVAEHDLFNEMLGAAYDPEDIAESDILKRAESKFREKIAQNDIIEVIHAVYGNSDPGVQKKINRVLNTKFVEDEAEFMESLGVEADTTSMEDMPTILSDEYQKGKLTMGADGKTGTGAYSLDVVFHGMAQQGEAMGHAIKLETIGQDRQPMTMSLTFGAVTSDGVL